MFYTNICFTEIMAPLGHHSSELNDVISRMNYNEILILTLILKIIRRRSKTIGTSSTTRRDTLVLFCSDKTRMQIIGKNGISHFWVTDWPDLRSLLTGWRRTLKSYTNRFVSWREARALFCSFSRSFSSISSESVGSHINPDPLHRHASNSTHTGEG